MNFSTYIFIGSIYSLVILLYNMFVATDEYKDESIAFKIAAYIFDLFLWPIGIACDVLSILKRANK